MLLLWTESTSSVPFVRMQTCLVLHVLACQRQSWSILAGSLSLSIVLSLSCSIVVYLWIIEFSVNFLFHLVHKMRFDSVTKSKTIKHLTRSRELIFASFISETRWKMYVFIIISSISEILVIFQVLPFETAWSSFALHIFPFQNCSDLSIQTMRPKNVAVEVEERIAKILQ